jgi:hypothetical protein
MNQPVLVYSSRRCSAKNGTRASAHDGAYRTSLSSSSGWPPTGFLKCEGTDDGVWRRRYVIPFNVTIPQAERDGNLPEKPEGELPGLLNWAIAGCLAWQKQGLQQPGIVTNATSEYRAEMDVVAQFLENECTKGT